jgi:large repetitive protein
MTKAPRRAALVALTLAALLAPIAPAEAGPRQAVRPATVASRTSSALAASSESLVAPGVTWSRGTWTTADGAQAVQLVELDPADPAISLETSSPAAGVNARQTVRKQALRVSRDGHRVVAAINGDVWNTDDASGTRSPIGLQVRRGELLTAARKARPTLGFGADEVPRLGQVSVNGSVTFAGGTTLGIDRINKPRRSGDLVLYTRRWGPSTSTLANGAEVVLTGATLPLRVAGSWTATVAKVVKAGGDVTIAAGALVLSAQGPDAAVIGSLAVGSSVTISTTITPGWEDVVEAIGGREWLVEDGTVGISPVSTFTTHVHPRTAVGLRSDGRLLLATVDGRQPGYSLGMTAADLADMLIAQGAVQAIMLDGGGSTTALVRRPGDVEATLVNRPSDGFQRAVDSALLVVSSVPTGPLASLLVRPSSRTMVVGQAASFSAHGVDAAINGIPIAADAVVWSMSGNGATLSSSGSFQARDPGSAAVTAAAGGLTGASDMTIVADTFPPVAADPALRLRRGGTVEAASVPVTISWAPATDIGTGVSGYELRRRFSGGSWSDIALPSPMTRTINQRLPPDSAVQYQVRATDRSGNVGAWQTAAGLVIRLAAEDSGAVHYAGTWRQRLASGFLGGAVRMARTAGARATFAFTGRQVAWIAARGPTRGSARVLIDGSRVGLVGLHSDSVRFRKAVFVSAWMTSGSHRIRVRVSGTAGHPRVDVDGFVIVERATLADVAGISPPGP